MSCIIENLKNLSIDLNECRTSIGGIKKLLVCNYSSNIYSKLNIVNNVVIEIDSSLIFREIHFNKFNSKYSDTFNYDLNKYEFNLNIELIRVSPEKRVSIDLLVKQNLVFIVQLTNGEYIILGEKSGIKSNSYNSTTDTYSNKSNYNYNFYFKNDYLPFQVSSDLVDEIQLRICADLNEELALSSTLFWLEYADCLIGDLDDFVNP